MTDDTVFIVFPNRKDRNPATGRLRGIRYHVTR